MMITSARRASALLTLLVGLLLGTTHASAQIVLSGEVYDGNGGPLVAGSVYVVQGDITVPIGKSLRLEPGAIVKFEAGRHVFVQGTISAFGSAAQPVALVSIKDDAYGGDTNGDGPSSGSVADWGGITISGIGAGSTLRHVDFRSFGASNFGSPVARGVYALGTAVIENCHFEEGRNPIRTVGAQTILNNTVDSCEGFAYAIDDLETLANFVGNTASNSTTNSVVVLSDEPVSVDTTITSASQVSGGILFAQSPSVAPGVTLTLGPGVNFKFNSDVGLDVQGSLVCNGTASERVHFTFAGDDTVGGDTNGIGFGTTFGAWSRLNFEPGSTGDFDYTTVKFANESVGVAGDVVMDHCRVQQSQAGGLDVVGNGSLGMTNCVVTECQFAPLSFLHVEEASNFANNDFAGNGLNIVSMVGDVTVDTIMRDGAFFGSRILWGSTIDAGATLTLEQGTELVGAIVPIVVNGGLVIDGVPENPVVLTPFNPGSVSTPSGGISIPASATGPCSIKSFLVVGSGSATTPAISNSSPLTTMSEVSVRGARSAGIQLFDLAGDLRNCVVSKGVEAGFDLRGGSFDVVNCTASENGTVGFGALGAFTGTVRNSIAWDNGLDNFFGLGAGEVFFSNGDAALAGTDGNLNVDPQFVHTLFNNLRLMPSSPLIDAGEVLAGAQGRDIGGGVRALRGLSDLNGPKRVDMGAYEHSRLALDVFNAVPAGQAVNIVLNDTASVALTGTQLVLSLAELEIPTPFGSLFTDLSAPSAMIAWPDSPSLIQLVVPEDIPAGTTFVIQAVAFSSFNGTVSNPEFLEIID